MVKGLIILPTRLKTLKTKIRASENERETKKIIIVNIYCISSCYVVLYMEKGGLMDNKNKIKPTITIDPDVVAEVKKIASANNRSFSNQMETIVIEWLKGNGRKEI